VTRGRGADEFKTAQEKYFGEASPLLGSAPSGMDEEILKERQRITSRYLAGHGAVVEVGPGAGFFASWLRARGHDVTLVEQSEALAQALRRKLDVRVETAEFEGGVLGALRAKAFFSFHVIEHVVEPTLHLRAGFEAVEVGGLGFIATPNARSWQQRLFQKLSPNFDSAHLRVFSVASLEAACLQVGWRILAIDTPEFTSGWLRMISKVVRKLKREDAERTAGKYAAMSSAFFSQTYALVSFLTYPLRRLQRAAGGGSEVLVVLQRPIGSIANDTSLSSLSALRGRG